MQEDPLSAGLIVRTTKVARRERVKVAVGGAILACIFSLIDPFGLSEQKAAAIDTFFLRLNQFRYASKAESGLAVLLIDDASLQHWQQDWPISHDTAAEIVWELACARVAAIFFDYVPYRQFDPASNDELLLSATRDSSKTGHMCIDGQAPREVPVFFASIDKLTSPFINTLRAENHTFPVDWQAPAGVYPAGRTAYPDHKLEDNEITPGFGLFRRLCTNRDGNDTRDHFACPSGKHSISTGRPLVLQWSGYVNPLQNEVSQTFGCRQDDPTGTTWWKALLAGFDWVPADDHQKCPPILTLTGEDLDRDIPYTKKLKINPTSLLAGRVVFVGTNLPGVNDFIESPVHGLLPGVYAHAVALDNLLTFGARYDTKPRPAEEWTTVILFFVCIEIVREFFSKKPLLTFRSPTVAQPLTRLLIHLAYANRTHLTASVLTQCGVCLMFAVFIRVQGWPWSLFIMSVAYYLLAVLSQLVFVNLRPAGWGGRK